jgi:hypothetical protein
MTLSFPMFSDLAGKGIAASTSSMTFVVWVELDAFQFPLSLQYGPYKIDNILAVKRREILVIEPDSRYKCFASVYGEIHRGLGARSVEVTTP